MAYLSELIGRPVADSAGEQVGKLCDVLASIDQKIAHPVITAIMVKQNRREICISYQDVLVLLGPGVSLRKPSGDLVPYVPKEHDVFLAGDVLDKQIIDTNGFRVVRVNDVELTRVNGSFYVANVDVGGMGLARRLGLAKTVQKAAKNIGTQPRANVISWEYVELIRPGQPIRLKVPGDQLSDLHPADLAEIISDLNREQTGQFLETLDVKTLADTLEEVETDFQASLVEDMSDEKVADVLEEMSPDEAADLLAELPEERSKDLLELMEDEDAADVRKLLTYDEESAGGIMTTEYAAVNEDLTAEQTICLLREEAGEYENLHYVYVVDKENHLIGVFSLSELVLSRPETLVSTLMHRHVVKAHLTDHQDKLAEKVAKYNLLAIPVVDDENYMHGIVTSDDALDKIIPTAWKKRLPRYYK
jgi:magnesium transporter